MDRTERFYKLLGMVRRKGIASRQALLEELEVSPATFKRDLEYLRSRLNVPIEWDREHHGYRIEPDALARGLAELPGLWFSADEAHALLTMYQLLSRLEPGLLETQIGPLKSRIEKLIESVPGGEGEALKRVRIISIGSRGVPARYFAALARALMERKQVNISYYNRERDETTPREVSPQRLTHYRDNWYLDGWCHLRGGLRCFSVDAISEVELLEAKAREVPESTLDRELAGAYGIFAGEPDAVAKLRFAAVRSRWIARESWHPDQKGSWDGQGRYLLEVPYHDDRELLMDILRHGAEVEVVGPAVLRRRHREQLEKALSQYS